MDEQLQYIVVVGVFKQDLSRILDSLEERYPSEARLVGRGHLLSKRCPSELVYHVGNYADKDLKNHYLGFDSTYLKTNSIEQLADELSKIIDREFGLRIDKARVQLQVDSYYL